MLACWRAFAARRDQGSGPFADAAQLRDLIGNDVDRRAVFQVFVDVRDATAEILENTSLADLIKQDKPRGAKSQPKRKESAAKVLPIAMQGKRAQERQ